MDNILLIMPDERKVYETLNVRAGAFHSPSLALGILGAIAKNNNYNPIILDLTLSSNNINTIEKFIDEYCPEYIGFTCTTATYWQVLEIAKHLKKTNPAIKLIIGGPHASSKPEETLDTDAFDYVFIAESEISFDKFLKSENPETIEGIAFKRNGIVHKKLNSNFIYDMDSIPIPDYTLYDLSKYNISKLQCRANPVVFMETSRGCPFDCQVCNKVVHGQNFRPKSPNRVIEEIKYLLSIGVKEFFITDDGFTSDIERAIEICDKIIENDLKIHWNCFSGIRSDRLNQELLHKMKAAGCHQISLGIESGNQIVLDNLGKKITLEQVRSAVKMAKKAGLKVWGFFMMGFEDETEQSMKDTIKFAKSLPLDLAKVAIVTPFPGAPLYAKYKKQGLIYPEGDYRHFNIHLFVGDVYSHPSLDWDIVKHYQKKFYRDFYFNPYYVLRRFFYAIKNRTFFSDIQLLFTTKWF